MIILTSIGIFGAMNTILASFKNKSLRTPCHIFIASNAFCDMLSQIGLYIPVFLTLSGINYMELQICWFMEVIPYCGVNAAVILTLSIGLDRLYSVLMPMNPVVCGITTLVVPSLSQYNFYATIVISLVILLVYGATWVVAKTKNQ
uniref:G-protein coupled receptors family 1 profile domain-containing protein n=1 Tax=Acrobeloides nanus TaxID=290746 RepID=A0A914EIB5_9BILA